MVARPGVILGGQVSVAICVPRPAPPGSCSATLHANHGDIEVGPHPETAPLAINKPRRTGYNFRDELEGPSDYSFAGRSLWPTRAPTPTAPSS